MAAMLGLLLCFILAALLKFIAIVANLLLLLEAMQNGNYVSITGLAKRQCGFCRRASDAHGCSNNTTNLIALSVRIK